MSDKGGIADMRKTNSSERLCAGIDFRDEIPNVCYWTSLMKEPQPMPLDFGSCAGRKACFRKILSALKKYGRKEIIRVGMVLPDLSEECINEYLLDACEAGFVREQLQVMSGSESVVHVIMHQSNDIWQQQIWLLEFQEDEIRATGFQVNKRSSPMLVQAYESEYRYIGSLAEGERDENFLEFIRECFGKKRVSAVFVTGTDLNEENYKNSRKELCFRRRVFLADQIYAQGACILAGDTERERTYLFLNEQTLLYNVGIRCCQAGKESVYTIIRAGCSWYEAHETCEVILMDEPVLEFSFQSMLGREPILGGMSLPDLPVRPERTSRLQVEVYFTGPLQCEVKVTDLGFGELYPASDLCWRESYVLEEQEEEEDGPGDNL